MFVANHKLGEVEFINANCTSGKATRKQAHSDLIEQRNDEQLQRRFYSSYAGNVSKCMLIISQAVISSASWEVIFISGSRPAQSARENAKQMARQPELGIHRRIKTIGFTPCGPMFFSRNPPPKD